MKKQKNVRSFHLRLPYRMFIKIKTYCAIHDISFTEFVIGALKKEMKERGIK